MAEFHCLSAFIAHLKQAQIVPRPENEEWKDMIERTGVPGRISEVDDETFDYFLDCLPPKYQGSGYAFCEGAEALKYFWFDESNKRHFCRQLTWEETVIFCRLAHIGLPW